MRDFLRPKSPVAARRAAQTIMRSPYLLESEPRLGRRVPDLPESYGEWPIPFGGSDYIAHYRFDSDDVIILAERHQREAGF